MPLDRPALALSDGPRSVSDARRWVVETLRELGREDLVECAELGVSELVTNALLHGIGPIEVRVRGTAEHPRVEVHDRSTEPPVLPTEELPRGYDDDEPASAESGADDAVDPDAIDPDSIDLDSIDLDAIEELLTFGRGLSMVARASDAWGADLEADGKTVWFAPAAAFAEELGPRGVISGPEPGTETSTPAADAAPSVAEDEDTMQALLLSVPVREFLTFQRHVRELRREVRLLALAHESDYPLARDLSDVFDRLGSPLQLDRVPPEITTGQAAGATAVDVRLSMSRAAAQGLDRFLELLELTDAFCREERMLTLARSQRQYEFQTWFLGEILRQGNHEAPRAFRPGARRATGSSAKRVPWIRVS